MANVTIAGATYSDVPAIQVPSGSGTASFYETKDVTYNLAGGATASVSPSEVVAGQGFSVKMKAPAGYNLSNVSVTMGGVDITSQVFEYDEGGGGGSPSATQHSIYFEFTDNTNTTITGYWDDSFISNAITATTPITYGGKTVTLAQLDGVTWYEPSPIPLNTQLIDFTKCLSDTVIDTSGQEISHQWYYATDYTEIDPSMTFSYKASIWHSICFYTSAKTFISHLDIQADGTADPTYSNVGVGTLTPSKIPSNAKYIRTCSIAKDSAVLSLIRTA